MKVRNLYLPLELGLADVVLRGAAIWHRVEIQDRQRRSGGETEITSPDIVTAPVVSLDEDAKPSALKQPPAARRGKIGLDKDLVIHAVLGHQARGVPLNYYVLPYLHV